MKSLSQSVFQSKSCKKAERSESRTPKRELLCVFTLSSTPPQPSLWELHHSTVYTTLLSSPLRVHTDRTEKRRAVERVGKKPFFMFVLRPQRTHTHTHTHTHNPLLFPSPPLPSPCLPSTFPHPEPERRGEERRGEERREREAIIARCCSLYRDREEGRREEKFAEGGCFSLPLHRVSPTNERAASCSVGRRREWPIATRIRRGRNKEEGRDQACLSYGGIARTNKRGKKQTQDGSNHSRIEKNTTSAYFC